MPVVIGVGRPFFSFASSGTAIGNFIRNLQFPSLDHKPTDITFNTPDDITVSVEGFTSSGNNYARIIKRNEETSVTDYGVYNTSNSVEDFSILSIDVDSSNNIHGCGYYELGGNIYPVYVKFDTNGKIVYAKYDSNASGRITTSISVRGSEVVFSGGDWNNTTLTVEPSYFGKIDSFGQIIWQRNITDVGATYTNFVYNSIKTQSDGSVILVGDFDGSKRKGLISKYSSSGAEVWHKTLEYHGDYDVYVTSSFVDDYDELFVVGYTQSTLSSDTNSFLVKYTKEGNILWQTQSPDTGLAFFRNTDVYADSAVGSIYTAGTFLDTFNDQKLCISKYDLNGTLIFKRTLDSNASSPSNIHYPRLTATNTDLYVTFSDEQNNSSVLYGRLSVSGNGLGDFQYNDGAGNTLVYSLISIPSNSFGYDQLGKLYEGTSYQLSSDFITYPFSATKLVFDDLATVYNAKSPVYEDNGQQISTVNRTPFAGDTAKISTSNIVYDSNLVLNYDFGNIGTYDANANTVNVFNLSSSSITGTINGATFNSAGYFEFDGVNDKITFPTGVSVNTSAGISVEVWVRADDATKYMDIFDMSDTYGVWMVFQSGLIKGSFATTSNQMTASYSINTWYHFVITGSGTSNIMYLNGVQVSTASASVYSGTANFDTARIGNVDGDRAVEYLHGDVAEFRFYNRQITATEVSQNFNATRAKYGV